MNLVQRAGGVVSSRASKAALAAVMLATLTIAGRAEIISFDPGACGAIHGVGGTCTIAILGTGGNPNANQVETYTNTAYESSFVGVNNVPEVELKFSGTATGSFDSPQGIPVSWDFDITNNHPGTTVSWSLLLEVFTSGPTYSDSLSGEVGSSASAQTVSGDSDITGVVGSVTGWEIELTATQAGSSNTNSDEFSVDIPGGATIVLNSDTPEPASIFLASAGLAILLLRWKRHTGQSKI